jgi:hypothetical protein
MGVSSRVREMLCVLGVTLAVVSAASSYGYGQTAKTMLVEPPAPLLPHQIGEWLMEPDPTGAIMCADRSERPESLVLGEDGLKCYEHALYRSTANTNWTITATARQFVDATGAHSAYTYYRRPGPAYSGPKIGDETGNGYLFRSGTTVVSADSTAPPAKTVAMLNELETHLPKVGGTKGLAPLLPTYLPAKGLERETIQYALGPVGYQAQGGVLPAEIVGFDKAAEAVTAKYEGKGTLTLLLYPTPQIAGDHGRQIEAEMNRQGSAAGTVKLRREGPLVLLTTGAWKPADAQQIVENIHLRNELTWNKPMPPEFHSEVRKTVSLLTSILIFCGLGALAAVVIALFLGGARAAIRVMQGKPAATEPEFLRIDLSGRPAQIQPEGPEAGRRR